MSWHWARHTLGNCPKISLEEGYVIATSIIITTAKWRTISRNVRLPKLLRFQHTMKCKCLSKRLCDLTKKVILFLIIIPLETHDTSPHPSIGFRHNHLFFLHYTSIGGVLRAGENSSLTRLNVCTRLMAYTNFPTFLIRMVPLMSNDEQLFS